MLAVAIAARLPEREYAFIDPAELSRCWCGRARGRRLIPGWSRNDRSRLDRWRFLAGRRRNRVDGQKSRELIFKRLLNDFCVGSCESVLGGDGFACPGGGRLSGGEALDCA